MLKKQKIILKKIIIKIIDMKNKLDYTENECKNLLLNYNQLYNELKKTKNELNKSGDDKLKEKGDYQEDEIKKLESKLNGKDKNINILKSDTKNLKNKNYKTIAKSNEYFEEIDKLKINNTNNQKIQELENYFNDNEENKIETEKKTKESKILNDKLIKEKEEIIKEFDNKEKLINEYELELDKLNYEHNQKVQEMTKELNDKGIPLDKLNKLNNEYEQIVQEMTKELNNKNISLNKYKENINKLDNEYKKEIQKLKKESKESKEYIDSDKKDKDKVIKKFNKLYNEKQNYIKEKQIIEQELANKKIIHDLNIKIKSLKDDNKLIKDFRKDSLPKYNEKLNRLENLENEYNNKSNGLENLEKEYQNDKEENKFIIRSKIKNLDFEKIEKKLKDGEFYEYELNISDSRIKYLDKMIKENPKISAKKKDIINQLKSLYAFRKDYFKTKIYNPEIKTPDLKPLDDRIRNLENEFRDQKGSRTFASQNKFVKLLTLLTQLLTKNTARNFKKFKDDINQILKESYDSKQITKQIYNNLIKAITYK